MAEAAERGRKRPREGDAALSAAAAAVEPQHMYLRIADALKVKRDPVSLFAVVAEVRVATKSGGTDFARTLRIADESRPAGISATFFAENTAQLPCVKSSRDVISLHKVKIKMHGRMGTTTLLYLTIKILHLPYLKAQYLESAALIRFLRNIRAANMTKKF